MIYHVSLKLRQIHRAPGTEPEIRSAPGQEILHSLLKPLSLLFQLFLGKMRNLWYFIMKRFIHLRAHQTAEFRYNSEIFVQITAPISIISKGSRSIDVSLPPELWFHSRSSTIKCPIALIPILSHSASFRNHTVSLFLPDNVLTLPHSAQ